MLTADRSAVLLQLNGKTKKIGENALLMFHGNVLLLVILKMLFLKGHCDPMFRFFHCSPNMLSFKKISAPQA